MKSLLAYRLCTGGLECLPYVVLPVPAGLVIGELADKMTNRTLYVAPTIPTSLPVAGIRRISVLATIRF